MAKLSRTLVSKVGQWVRCQSTTTTADCAFSHPLPYDAIPSPKGLPVVGTLIEFLRSGASRQIHRYCDRRHRELGPIYRETLGNVEAVFVADGDLIQRVYSHEGKYPQHLIPEAWLIYNETTGCKRGLFFMEGTMWSERRRSLNKVFLRPASVVNHVKDFNSVISDVLNRWESILDQDNVLPHLEKELYNWSIECLGTFIFGRRMGCITSDTDDIKRFVECVQQIFVESARMTTIPPRLAHKLNLPVWRRFVKAIGMALQIARGLVEDKVSEIVSLAERGGGGVDGLLSQLLLTDKIDEEEIVRIVTDLFLAAADTTSHSTQWALHLLAQNPQCQDRLLEEVRRVVPRGEIPNETHLPQMPYVKAIVKEALRLYPVAPFLTRILSEDLQLGGYHIPAGKLLLMSLYSTGRDSKYFRQPESFLPERWIRREGGRDVITTHACLPFGMGTRSCIGRRIAEAQMYLLLARLVHRFQLSSANETEVTIAMRMITTPSEAIRLRLTARDPHS